MPPDPPPPAHTSPVPQLRPQHPCPAAPQGWQVAAPPNLPPAPPVVPPVHAEATVASPKAATATAGLTSGSAGDACSAGAGRGAAAGSSWLASISRAAGTSGRSAVHACVGHTVAWVGAAEPAVAGVAGAAHFTAGTAQLASHSTVACLAREARTASVVTAAAQQISLLLPQPTQDPPEQRAPAAVQVVEPPPNPPPAPLPQQVWPTAPHVVPVVVWHDPLEQVPLVPAPMHADPLPTHIPAMQHPPPWQLFAAQQVERWCRRRSRPSRRSHFLRWTSHQPQRRPPTRRTTKDVSENQVPGFISQELVIVSTPNGMDAKDGQMSDAVDFRDWCQTTVSVVINSWGEARSGRRRSLGDGEH